MTRELKETMKKRYTLPSNVEIIRDCFGFIPLLYDWFTLSTNQKQNLNHLRLGRSRFSRASGSLLVFNLSSRWLMII